MNKFMPHFLIACASLACASAQAGLKEDVAAKEAEISGLRAKVDTLTPRLLVNDADVRVFLSLTPLVSAVSGLNALPDAGRTVVVRSTGAHGRFWQDSQTFCNSYAELSSANALQATALLSTFGATMRDDGAIDLATRVAVAGRVQIHVHFMGVRVRPRLFGQPIGGGVCPPGGGAGTSIGVSFDKTKDMAMRLSFAAGPDGRSLAYTARITAPDKIDVTAQIPWRRAPHDRAPARLSDSLDPARMRLSAAAVRQRRGVQAAWRSFPCLLGCAQSKVIRSQSHGSHGGLEVHDPVQDRTLTSL